MPFDISIWRFYTGESIRNVAYIKNSFWNTVISYEGSLWTDSCYQLWQI